MNKVIVQQSPRSNFPYQRGSTHLMRTQLNPWFVWAVCLLVCATGVFILDRLLRPHDTTPNVLLAAFVGGVIIASLLAQPLRHSPYLVRNLEVVSYLDTFLVCAVASWLGVRLLLGLSGNPRVGGGGIHVAHMLWGGALMLTGIVINFVYLGRYGRRLVAILTGLGFGLFIDELGKFITSTNNYLYKPATPIIYAVFVLLYLLIRLLARKPSASQREYLVNAVDALQEAVIRDLDQKAVDRARRYLAGATSRDEMTQALIELLEDIRGTERPRSRLHDLLTSIERFYVRLIRNVWFLRLAAGVFLVMMLVSMVSDVQGTLSLLGIGQPMRLPGSREIVTFSNATGLVVSAIAGAVSDVLVLAGAVLLFRSRVMAYQLWKAAILIFLLLGGTVAIYYIQYQFVAAFIVNVLAIVVLTGLIREERRRDAQAVKDRSAATRKEEVHAARSSG